MESVEDSDRSGTDACSDMNVKECRQIEVHTTASVAEASGSELAELALVELAQPVGTRAEMNVPSVVSVS